MKLTEEQLNAIRIILDFVERVNKKDEDREVAEAAATLWCMTIDRTGFVECDTCRAKAGSPQLCNGCLHNRSLLQKLEQAVCCKYCHAKIRVI